MFSEIIFTILLALVGGLGGLLVLDFLCDCWRKFRNRDK